VCRTRHSRAAPTRDDHRVGEAEPATPVTAGCRRQPATACDVARTRCRDPLLLRPSPSRRPRWWPRCGDGDRQAQLARLARLDADPVIIAPSSRLAAVGTATSRSPQARLARQARQARSPQARRPAGPQARQPAGPATTGSPAVPDCEPHRSPSVRTASHHRIANRPRLPARSRIAGRPGKPATTGSPPSLAANSGSRSGATVSSRAISRSRSSSCPAARRDPVDLLHP